VTCPGCGKRMVATIGDYDYTKLAALRGKTVTLGEVRVYTCTCGEEYVEIPRMAALHRALVAADALTVKALRMFYEKKEGWTVVIPMSKEKI
jgi:hypothetical protein